MEEDTLKKGTVLNDILTKNYHFLITSSLFYVLSPTEYFKGRVIQSTNKELIESHEKSRGLKSVYC